MVIGIIGTLVGLVILGAGVYYLIKEKWGFPSSRDVLL